MFLSESGRKSRQECASEKSDTAFAESYTAFKNAESGFFRKTGDSAPQHLLSATNGWLKARAKPRQKTGGFEIRKAKSGHKRNQDGLQMRKPQRKTQNLQWKYLPKRKTIRNFASFLRNRWQEERVTCYVAHNY